MPAQSCPLTPSLLLNALFSPSPWLPYANEGGFLLDSSFYFYIKYFSLFWRDSFREESTCTLPQSFKVSHLFWAFCDGKMCCACRACGALGDGAKSLACRDPADMWEPTSQRQ